MPDVRLPLSGNVTQSINPWTWFFNPVDSPFSVITVNMGSSANPLVEEHILEDVGSYGRQIGRIGDALRVLLAHIKLDNLSPVEQQAIDALKDQLDTVDLIKMQNR